MNEEKEIMRSRVEEPRNISLEATQDKQEEPHSVNKGKETKEGVLHTPQGAHVDAGISETKKEETLKIKAINFLKRCYVEWMGTLKVMNGHGFLRSASNNYMPGPDDVFVSPTMIREYGLKTGDVIEGLVRLPLDNERNYQLVHIDRINFSEPWVVKYRVPFEQLTPVFPYEKFELTGHKETTITLRIIDLFAPIGKGQRGLIVAQPKTGKTRILKEIAKAIELNHPEVYIIVLLIGERPEEVTDMQRSVGGEVVYSTFDETPEKQQKVAEFVLEKAKRLVECGKDVVILMDSLTRLARAYNVTADSTGKIMTGGLESRALETPKKFFGSARKIENGGSLTIIATALIETGSKMDDIIYEEFKGTGNMEIQLDRRLANKRVFPAINIDATSTRRDDLLLPPEVLHRVWLIRKVLANMDTVEAMETLISKMSKTSNNAEFLATLGLD